MKRGGKMADGELIFDTKVDTDNFEKGIKDIRAKLKNISTSVGSLSTTTKKAFDGMSSAQIGLVNSLEQTKKKMTELKSKIEEIESVKVPTEKYTKLQEKVQSLKNEYKSLIEEQKKQKSFTGYNANSAEAKALDEQIKETRKQLNISSIQLSNLKKSGSGFEAQGTTAESAGLREKLNVEESKFIKLNKQLEELNQKEENATKSASKLKNALNNIGGATKKFGNKMASAFKKSTDPAQKFIKKLTSIGTMLKARVIRALVSGIVNGVKNGFNNLVQYSSKLNTSISSIKSSFTQLNNALATAFMPILQKITPIIQNIINKMIEAINVVAQFTARLFNNSTTFTKAKKINEDYAKSLSNTSKEQKKAFSFDTIEKIDSKTDDGSVSASEMFEEANIENRVLNFVDNVKAKLTDLITVLEPLKQFSFTALKDFYSNFLIPVGSWTLGTALPELVSVLKNGLAKINLKKINVSLLNLFKALTPFSITLGEGLLWIIDNILIPLSTFIINDVVPSFLELLASNFLAIDSTIETLKPMGEWLWNNFLKPIAEWTGGKILDILDGLASGLKNFSNWISDNQALVEDLIIVIGSFAAAWGLVNIAVGLWNICAGVATGVTTALGTAVAFLTSPIGIAIIAIGALIAVVVLLVKHWDEIKEVAQKCWAGICETWNNVADWFHTNIVTPIANFFGGLWKGIKNGASTLADFMKSKVINPIVNLFEGMYNSVVGIVEGIVNGFIGIINGFINGINRAIGAINDIPGVYLPRLKTMDLVSIPRLATGTVVPANYGEFAAILGDNKRETEVVSPLSTMKQALIEALAESGFNNGGDATIILELDGNELGRAVYRLNKKESKRIGTSTRITGGAY